MLMQVNENISLLYVIYQTGLFAASIVGPGSIFMMMIGAMDVALGGRLGFVRAGILTIIPIIIFIILCYTTKTDTQVCISNAGEDQLL
jgi:chitin synthase